MCLPYTIYIHSDEDAVLILAANPVTRFHPSLEISLIKP